MTRAVQSVLSAFPRARMHAPIVSVSKVKAKRAPRKPTLPKAAKAASKAGIEVARYELRPDGTIVVVTGKPDVAPTNDLDKWMAKRHAH